ncbi:hypothetical protein ACFLZW_07310, partial [Chloroflexota bacterium]
AEVLLQFGGEGSGAGQFDDPREIAMDMDGNIYIADHKGGRVQKFDPDGKFVFLINVEADQNDNIYIQALATDYAGKLYVVRGGDILIYSTEDGSPAGSIPGIFPSTNYDALAISPANELYALHGTASGEDLIKLDTSGQTLWRQQDFIEQIDKEATITILKLAVDGLGNSYAVNMTGGFTSLTPKAPLSIALAARVKIRASSSHRKIFVWTDRGVFISSIQAVFKSLIRAAHI